jgi:hypothetical protein
MAAAVCGGGMAASCKLMASSVRAMGALRRGSRVSRRQTELAPRLYLRKRSQSPSRRTEPLTCIGGRQALAPARTPLETVGPRRPSCLLW